MPLDITKLEYISTLQVAARIRTGKLPEYNDGGQVRCACHPNIKTPAQTEALRFWSKGMKIPCSKTGKFAPALAAHENLGIVIDTRR